MVFRLLRELVGGSTDLNSINRERCREIREVLIALPPNATKRFPGMTLTAAAEMAKVKKLPGLNPQTINSHLNKVSALFNWAVREEMMSKNPAVGLMVDDRTNGGQGKREQFTSDQLTRIFNSPLYCGCLNDEAGYSKPGPEHPRRARFWVPLLSLFHGLRLNEAC